MQSLLFNTNLDESTLPTPDRVFLPSLTLKSLLSYTLGRFRVFYLSHGAFKSEPSLYHVALLANRPPFSRLKLTILLRAIQNKPATFFRGGGRQLYIDDQVTDLERCVYRHHKSLRNYTFAFPISFTHSMFRQVTHLEVLEPPDGSEVPSPTGWATLPLIPHLTHFAFSSVNLAVILAPIVITCARLECAIFHLQDTWEEAEVEADVAWSANDAALLLCVKSWISPQTGYTVRELGMMFGSGRTRWSRQKAWLRFSVSTFVLPTD
ncbi:hypothetical protein DFH09DRAFT_1481206 [Mycena vulgaris]|nr:hypothetical protein DFH09DRAFT_1481206 [Mycena vulgaris]